MMLVWKSIPPFPQYIYNTDKEILIRVMKALVLPWPYLGRKKVTEEDKRVSSLLCLNNSEILSWPSILSERQLLSSDFKLLVLEDGLHT